jgi:putative ABC transport system permease protein
MNIIGWVRSLIRNLFLRVRIESELDLEVRSYAALVEEENMSKGMSPEEARRNARIEIGGPEQIKEEVREARRGAWIETVWQDLRSGARMLRRNRGFAVTAILTLALGIGANTAIFSVVRAVLLSSLPYRHPDQLVKIWGQLTAEGIPKNSFSDPEFFELLDTNQAFEQAIRRLHADILPRIGKLEFDPTMLWFALGMAVFAGLLFGLAPAIHTSRPRLHDAMKAAGREGTGGRRGLRMRNALVISEIAFSLLLVTGAGLAIRSFYRLLRVDPGFRTDHILTMRMTLPSLTYPKGPVIPQFFNQLLGRIRAMPGVESAGAISQLPMGGYRSSGSVFIENSHEPVLQHTPVVPYGYIETDQMFATLGYFETMKTPLELGRRFSDADTAASIGVVIVDTKFAASVWPGQNPLQKRVCMNFSGDPKSPQPQWRTVVGVVAHVHNDSLDAEGRGQAYFPQTQDPFGDSRAMFVTVRTAHDPVALANSVRAQVLAMDRSEPVYSVRTMDEVVATSVEQPRLSHDLLALFASLAFALAAIGIYGIIAFTVSQRKHELGIRMALGAQPWQIRRMVIGQGARLAFAGVAIGLATALYLARYMAPLLYGIETRDPVTFAIVPVLLLGVTLAATCIPAVRATRIDPIETLRHQ